MEWRRGREERHFERRAEERVRRREEWGGKEGNKKENGDIEVERWAMD